MANLKEVKGRIQSVNSTKQITKAMKMVAAAKLRKAQERIIQMRPYAKKLSETMGNVSARQTEGISNPYSEIRKLDQVLLVVVSSDRGLCGAFNSSLFKFARNLIKDQYAEVESHGRLDIMPVGKKALEYFQKRNYNVIDECAHLIEKISFQDTSSAAEMMMEKYKNLEYDKIEIIYNEFKNVATQVIQNERFLPIDQVKEDTFGNDDDYIFEPSKDFIFYDLLPKLLKIQFYKILLESNAAEHGARMTAMDKATENADELLKELRLSYNRTRQAAITTEILEIVGGAEALAQT